MHDEMQIGPAPALLPPRHALQQGFQVNFINGVSVSSSRDFYTKLVWSGQSRCR